MGRGGGKTPLGYLPRRLRALLGMIKVASCRHCRAAAQRGSKQSSCSVSSASPVAKTLLREEMARL